MVAVSLSTRAHCRTSTSLRSKIARSLRSRSTEPPSATAISPPRHFLCLPTVGVDSRRISEGKRNARSRFPSSVIFRKLNLPFKRKSAFLTAGAHLGDRDMQLNQCGSRDAVALGGWTFDEKIKTSPGPDGPGKRLSPSFPGGWRQAERAPPWARPQGAYRFLSRFRGAPLSTRSKDHAWGLSTLRPPLR